MKLRDYQEAAVDSLFEYFEENDEPGNPLVAMPTGTGKSPVLCDFIKKAFLKYPSTRVIQATHVKELIQQNYNTMLELWPTAPCGIFSSGLGRKDYNRPITFAGVASLVKQVDLFERVDLFVVDEAHLMSPNTGTMYQTIIKELRVKNPYLKVIGLTATPYRLGQGMLTDEDGIFDDICMDQTSLDSFNWFIDQGYLVPLVPKKTHTEYDVEKIKIHAGEFAQKDLQQAVDIEEITRSILKETLELGQGRKHWLVFASGIEHAMHVQGILEDLGISAAYIHSKMPDEKRDKNLADFKLGKYQAMVNNGILTTGFDFRAIDMIVMLRPTQSPGLWVQMLGRGTRPVYFPGYNLETLEGRLNAIKASKKQNCLVLDFAGNTRRLGPINDPVVPKRKGKGGGGQAPIKLCEACNTYNHAAVRFCVNCGAEFPKEVKISIGASTEELIARTDLPQVEEFKVTRITHRKHEKEGRPTSIRVSYYCGFRLFEEWICLEHTGYAKIRARKWWMERSTKPELGLPESAAEGLLRINELKVPTKIYVWINKEPAQIMRYSYE